MEIPKEIKNSIKKSAKYFQQAREHEKIVREWLSDQGLENDFVHDNWIDTIEYGYGNSQAFIDFLYNYKEE